MTDTYEQLKNLFEDEQTIDDLWDSEDIVWIDWREDDEDIISYFNDLLEEQVEVQTVDNGKPYGPDIVLSKDGKQLQIPYGQEKDRDTTIKYFNDFVKEEYEVRWFVESLGDDTLGFIVLPAAEWQKLEDDFGEQTVSYYFAPIDLETKMFDLDVNEVFSLIELRAATKEVK